MYLKEHKELPPRSHEYPPVQQQPSPYPYQPSPYPYPQYSQAYGPYAPALEKISEEYILDTRGRKLWGILASIGIPLAAFVILNLLIVGIEVLLIFTATDYNSLLNFITSPLFLVLSSLFELILMFFPVLYVGKYLQIPSFKNRLNLLGFTSKGYVKSQILKEILIGMIFAVIGFFLVGIVSASVELFLEYAFGINITTDSGAGNDITYIISSGSILGIIGIVLVMLLVVGTSEEILFRGFMQKGLTRKLGQTWGLLITAFIFAIIHLTSLFLTAVINPMTPFVFFINFVLLFAPYLSISLMLGWLYRWRRENLIANMITHGVYNSLTIIISFLIYVYF